MLELGIMAVCVGVAVAALILSFVSIGLSFYAIRKKSEMAYQVVPMQKPEEIKQFEEEMEKIINPGRVNRKEDFENLGIDPEDLV